MTDKTMKGKTMSETKNNEETQQTTESKESPEIIEVEWEEIEKIYNLRKSHTLMEQNLAILCIEHEKTKQQLVQHIVQSESTLNELGLDLLDIKGIDTTKTHELKLPTSPGEKAYFVRKA